MITFIIALLVLVGGYFLYGSYVERVFGPDKIRKTPALTMADGVDFIPLPTWKIFMIQFLNIAGLGPIFGAIMGAKFGTASYLWIVLGTIFAGAVHDYLSGMLSIRHDGESLPEIIGRYLGLPTKQLMRGFTVVLMILVGAVFVAGPAGLLAKLTPEYMDVTFWIIVVFVYYMLATLLPVDKIIGKIYPLFAIALLFMAVGILVMLLWNHPALPEITDGLHNTHPAGLPIFPIMFVSIACGAISGFHATQSPLMARCMKNEKYGRPIFYGAMVTEGIVALIWAAAATCFFHQNGMEESNASIIVDSITKEWLGTIGGLLAVLGVIAAPITSGDTALRSARLIVADFMHLEQKSIGQGRANLTIDFMYNKKNKTGTVALSGTWQQGNRESKSIRRNIEYTWIENYDTAHLTSKKVNKFEIMDQVDDDRLVQLIPDFYVFPEKSVSYNILKQGKHAFILSIGNRAIMHCAR